MEIDSEITLLLRAWQAGDHGARDELFTIVNEHMYVIAKNLLRGERQRYAIQATDLVNECVLRLFGVKKLAWRDRAHFIGVAAATMRRILVDEARRRNAQKRDAVEVTLVTGAVGGMQRPLDVIDLEEAMLRLADESPEQNLP